MRHALPAACLVAGGALNPAVARDLFEFTLTSEGSTVTRGFSDAGTLFDQLEFASLQSLIPAYTPFSAATARLDVRGLPAIASFEANSPLLRFQVPSLDIDLRFGSDGVTRDFSQDLFEEFLDGEGEDILTRLLRGFVAQTPVDPVAGNPNSLMAGMAHADFDMAASAINVRSAQGGGEQGRAPNLFGSGLIAGRSEAAGFDTRSYRLPLQYIFTPWQNEMRQLIIDAPLRYSEVAGAEIYDASLALGMRIPVAGTWWAITPSARAGVVGTTDAGAAQAVYSFSANSRAQLPFDKLDVFVNNSIGNYRTASIGSEYDGDYDLSNMIWRNGIALGSDVNWKLFGEVTTWELQLIDTRVTGDDWFIDQYNEVVFTVGTLRRAELMEWQVLRLGARYTFADDYDSFQLVFGYRF